MKEKDFLKYKVVSINTTRFIYAVEPAFKDEKIKLKVDAIQRVDDKNKLINIDVVSVIYLPENNQVLVEHIAQTTYQAYNLLDFYDKKTDKYDIPKTTNIAMYSIAYTHARVLMAIELNKTPMANKFYLPLIDPAQLLP